MSNFYIWNGSTSTQYLTCFMPGWNLTYVVSSKLTSLYWTAGSTPGTVTCTAQSGYYAGTNVVAQGNTQNLALAMGVTQSMSFPALPRVASYYSINMICSVPAGFKLGLIQNYENDPPSGFGWVP